MPLELLSGIIFIYKEITSSIFYTFHVQQVTSKKINSLKKYKIKVKLVQSGMNMIFWIKVAYWYVLGNGLSKTCIVA